MVQATAPKPPTLMGAAGGPATATKALLLLRSVPLEPQLARAEIAYHRPHINSTL